jgi:hypothetical protein
MKNWGGHPPCLLTVGSANALLYEMGGTSSDTPEGFELFDLSFFCPECNRFFLFF